MAIQGKMETPAMPMDTQKNVIDGTVQGGKRKYKTANGIYQPPLQPFKHLA